MNAFNTLNTDGAVRALLSGERDEAHTRAWGQHGAMAAAPFDITEEDQSKAGTLPLGGGEARRRREGSYTPTSTDKRSKLHPLGGGKGKAETATTVVVNLQN